MPNSETTADWRELYRKALFEADSEKVLVRINLASQAIRCRVCSNYGSSARPMKKNGVSWMPRPIFSPCCAACPKRSSRRSARRARFS